MPVTLAQAALNAASDIDRTVIEETRKSSWLFDNLTFADVVNPDQGGGATLTYGYQRLVTEATADFRAINAEYTPQEATKQEYTVQLKPFGGSYQIDRVLSAIAFGREVAFQTRQKIAATRALFNDTFINGDTAVDADAFDGLDKALTGTSTEYDPLDNGESTGYLDLTTVASQADAIAVMAHIDAMLAELNGEAMALLGNRKLITRIVTIARWAHLSTDPVEFFGRRIQTYGGVPLVDLGDKPGSSDPVVPIETRDPDAGGAGGNITGLTDLYAVRLGLDGVHAISLAGQPPVRNWAPDFSTSGAVKTGEVEAVMAIALKATRSAAVLRNLKVS